MPKIIEKVTAFVTRQTENRTKLLLFKHPYAGIQIPAGTVDPGETPEVAVIREVREETGLTDVKIIGCLGMNDEKLPKNTRVIIPSSTVYSRPDRTSFDWVRIQAAVQVKVERKADGFTQVTYIEHDQVPDPNYISMQITGWVSDDDLTDARRRHFFHLEFTGQPEDRWTIFSDNHNFLLFWAPLNDLPEIISPQDTWLKYLQNNLRKPGK